MSSTVFYESATEVATLTNTFSVSGTPTDPTTISLAVTDPAGTTTTYTYALGQITRTSAGVYTKNVAVPLAGDWTAVWTGTGAAADVQPAQWTVFGTTKLYCTAATLKSRFGITDTNDDLEINRAIVAASRRVESYTGRPRFWRDAAVTVREYEAVSSNTVLIPEGISTETGLIVKTDEGGLGSFDRTLTIATDYLGRPRNALADGWPYFEVLLADNYTFPIHSNGRAGVQVTARFGWPSVPADVSEACLILSHRLFKRKETSSGVVGFDALGATVRLSRTDPDVAELLDPYRVFGIA